MENQLSPLVKKPCANLKEAGQVLIQRHARSLANESYAKIKDLSDFEEVSKWICDPKFRDPKLSETGHHQCREARPLVNGLKIHTVFVSPMRRTLETAYLVYHTHPDFKNIRFVILPVIRESLNTSSDIPSDIDFIVEEFRELIPQLDDSLLEAYCDRKHYFIEDLQDEVKNVIQAELGENTEDPLGSNAYDLFIRESKKIFPARLESRWNVYDRSVKTKNFVKNYIKNYHIPKDQKIILLAHCIYFYMHTGKWDQKCSRKEELPYPAEFIRMKNCEITEDPSEYDV
ncbi:unnamed protein product [Moneuplotes crassus]|uniref:Uncharacterized protein n=1 Tax=Euplotes crassus TaxID=5936 RepID=A0AAD1XRP1_EUPCR|nr:unnamed protein product [Moneuplotes crassus]